MPATRALVTRLKRTKNIQEIADQLGVTPGEVATFLGGTAAELQTGGAGGLKTAYAGNVGNAPLALAAGTLVPDYSKALNLSITPSRTGALIAAYYYAEFLSNYETGVSYSLELWGHWNAEARKKFPSSYVVPNTNGVGVWVPKSVAVGQPANTIALASPSNVFRAPDTNPITLEVGGFRHSAAGTGTDSPVQIRNQECWLTEVALPS